jgi:hypothetical protein
MKKIFLILLLFVFAVVGYSQNTPYGTKIRNNMYQVKGTDTTWFQLNDTALLYNSSKKMKFNDTLFMVSVAEGQRAVDSFVLVLDSAGRVGYLPIDSVGSTGGGGTGWDSIYVENVKWIQNLDTIPTTSIDSATGSLANRTTPMDTLFSDFVYSGGWYDSLRWIINPPHAWMRFADSSITVNQTQDTWYQVTNTTDSLYRVLELSGGFTWSDDTLIAPIKGHYVVTFELGLDVGSNNNAEVRVNTTDGEISKMVGGSGVNGQYDAISCNAYWNADAGDRIWFEYRNTTDNDDFDLIASIVTVIYLHPIH